MFSPLKCCYADKDLHVIFDPTPFLPPARACVSLSCVKPGSGKVCLSLNLLHYHTHIWSPGCGSGDQVNRCFDCTLPLLLSMINEQSVTAAATFTLPSFVPTWHFNLAELRLLRVQWTLWVRGLQSVGTWSEGCRIEEDGWCEKKSKGSWRLAGRTCKQVSIVDEGTLNRGV